MRPATAAPEHHDQDRARWSAAGLDRLTGPPDGPALGPPQGFVARLDALTARLRSTSRALGAEVDVDGLAELAVRSEVLGHRRRGSVSCGGSCHLIRASDGWFAVSLARPDDWDLVPAWLGCDPCPAGDWDEVHRSSATRTVAEAVERGVLLGLPVGGLAEQRARVPDRFVPIEAAERSPTTGAAALDRRRPWRVADLTSMWAGPLCASLLAAAGAEVHKVESRQRPDGTRRGAPALHRRWNAGKHAVEVDLGHPDGIEALRDLLRSVDVVVESSRPRALRHLGIVAEDLLAEPDGPSLWVSITGHGRDPRNASRVAFGDDAAVSGGLVSWWEGRPLFLADAVADPLTGLWATAATLDALSDGRRGVLDVAMSRVAAHFAGDAAGPAR